MEPRRAPFARCIAVCALMCLGVSVSHATAQTQASTTPSASPTVSSASDQSPMSALAAAKPSVLPTANTSRMANTSRHKNDILNYNASSVSTATADNLTTITSSVSPKDSTTPTNNQTTGSTLPSPGGSTVAPSNQTSGPTASSPSGSTPVSTTSGPSTGPTPSACEQPTAFQCHRFTDGANSLILCRWEGNPRDTCPGYTVHCAANTTSLGQPQSFTNTAEHIILFQNVLNDINYRCTLNTSNYPESISLVTRKTSGTFKVAVVFKNLLGNGKGKVIRRTDALEFKENESGHYEKTFETNNRMEWENKTFTFVLEAGDSGLSSGQIVTIVLLLVIVVVCLIFLRKFYLKIRKLERQYNNDEGVCLLPKGIRGFQKETIVKESAPIPAKVLRQTVQTKSASGSKLFQEEFSNFPRKINKYSQQEATQEYNTKKNRYSDILPYDHNRVKLSGEGESDYINASYVDGYNSSIRYIAAQGPLENTAGDFWQMIWEKKSSVIVMVTKCEEMGKVKCFQYWPHPDEDKRAYGDVTVTIMDEKPYADIVIRTLSISHSKHRGFGAHWVTHVQLVSWPDHGVPEDPNLLLKLRRRVNSFNGAGCTAVVVHCSAGVGRSGTYIGLDCLVRQLENEGHVDVYGCVFRLRHQRPLMVQVESQYVLLHRALLEHHLFGNTELSMAKLHSRVQGMKFKGSQQDESPVDVEFKRLPTFEGTFAQRAGRNSNNVNKNRSTNVIPYDFNRVKLWKFTLSEINDENDDNNSDEYESDNENSDKDYINASFMDGYHKQKSIIATQNPLPDTVSDFWLMVVQQNCNHIVMLSELSEGGKEQSAHYWPVKGTQNYGAVGVTVKNVTSRRDLVVRELSLTYENKESVVTQIQYPHWKPDGLPKSPKALVSIMNAVQGWQKENGNHRHIVVHCSDGASRTGTFCALWNTLEAARIEGMVDFFQAVKWLNMQRPEIVKNKVHYRFLYETVCSFVNSTNGIQNAYTVALENVGSMHSVDIISEL
uniref:Tyrosine-protein phosphatase non-receptor type 20 n=1 Tax=Petromyzon marinus TaxID=7757 RepID=Q8AV93_PETMA|nr:CD45 protein tyrosine phosphatase receptor type C [Petromyzon marinus]